MEQYIISNKKDQAQSRAFKARTREQEAFDEFKKTQGPFGSEAEAIRAFDLTPQGVRLSAEAERTAGLEAKAIEIRERETNRRLGQDRGLITRAFGKSFGADQLEADIATAKADIKAGKVGGVDTATLDAEVAAFGDAVETAIGDSELVDALAENTESLDANTETQEGFTQAQEALIVGAGFGRPTNFGPVADIEAFMQTNPAHLSPEFLRSFRRAGATAGDETFFGAEDQLLQHIQSQGFSTQSFFEQGRAQGKFRTEEEAFRSVFGYDPVADQALATGGSMASVSGAQGFAAGGFSAPVSAAPVRLQLWVSLDEGLTGRLWDEQGRDQAFRGTVEYNQ